MFLQNQEPRRFLGIFSCWVKDCLSWFFFVPFQIFYFSQKHQNLQYSSYGTKINNKQLKSQSSFRRVAFWLWRSPVPATRQGEQERRVTAMLKQVLLSPHKQGVTTRLPLLAASSETHLPPPRTILLSSMMCGISAFRGLVSVSARASQGIRRGFLKALLHHCPFPSACVTFSTLCVSKKC